MEKKKKGISEKKNLLNGIIELLKLPEENTDC